MRDALLGVLPHDFDVATSATPEEVELVFPQSLSVGRQFGVMIVPFRHFQVEVTTFRSDGEYKDGRHPSAVAFSRPEEDAKRRDFTVNALFYDLSRHEVIDYVAGLKDLNGRVLRAVGDPYLRFDEDKLRMLRVARFAAQLGFSVDEETLNAVCKRSSFINVVSKERITEEFKKLCRARDSVQGFMILKDTGLLRHIWPTLKLPETSYWPLFLRSLRYFSYVRSFEITVAELILLDWHVRKSESTEDDSGWHTVDLKVFDEFSVPFILSREERKLIHFLIKGYFVLQKESDEGLFLLNEESGPLLTELGFGFSMLGLIEESKVSGLIERYLTVADKNGRLPTPFLKGQDLMELGIKPSSYMGELLRENYMAQIRGELTSKEEAIAWIQSKLSGK